MQSADAATFDEAYYARYYFDKKTKVADPRHVERLGAFVASYLKYLRVPVHRVLDVGCGIGLWRDIVARHFPQASYQGVEVSEYLCERYGWERGSVVDYRAQEPFDFVICQGVLAYLSPGDLKPALRNRPQYPRMLMHPGLDSLISFDRTGKPHEFAHGNLLSLSTAVCI